MKLSCALLPAPGVGTIAQHAEEIGYHRVFLPDSPALYGDVWIAVAEAAAATKTIGLGTAVLVPSLRHVSVTAAAIAHIEAIAPGRLEVALGTGFTARRMFGKPAIRLAEFETYVDQLRRLLRGEEVEVDGQVTRLMHPEGLVAARPLETPLILAAGGPKTLALAQRIGDGVMCAAVATPGAKDAKLLVMGTVVEEGEERTSPRVVEAIGPAMAVVLHGTYEAAGEAVDAIPGGAGWRKEIESYPEEVRHLHVHEGHLVELSERDRRNLAPELVDFTFTGTANELQERTAELEAQGVSELVYWPLGNDTRGELSRMAEAVGS